MSEQSSVDASPNSRVAHTCQVADLTHRSVLGDFAITASHSTGADYGPAQELATHLFDAGLDGIFFRVRHDPGMKLEGVALFGEPGETRDRFGPPKTASIPALLMEEGRQFHIDVCHLRHCRSSHRSRRPVGEH